MKIIFSWSWLVDTIHPFMQVTVCMDSNEPWSMYGYLVYVENTENVAVVVLQVKRRCCSGQNHEGRHQEFERQHRTGRVAVVGGAVAVGGGVGSGSHRLAANLLVRPPVAATKDLCAKQNGKKADMDAQNFTLISKSVSALCCCGGYGRK